MVPVKKALLLLVLLFLGYPLTSSAGVTNEEMCAYYFRGAFHESNDAQLKNIGARLGTNFGVKSRIVFCVGTGNDSLDFAMSRDFYSAIFIAIDWQFLRDFNRHIEAVVAHEIAHSVVPDGNSCSRLNGSQSVACESSVDMGAALVVGKSAVLHMLKDLSAHIRSKWGHVDGIETVILAIEQREHLLRKMTLPD